MISPKSEAEAEAELEQYTQVVTSGGNPNSTNRPFEAHLSIGVNLQLMENSIPFRPF